MTLSLHRALVSVCFAVAVCPAVRAQSTTVPAPPEGVVNLTASASLDLANDWMSVVFSTTREGADAGTVQSQLKQALDTALNEARKVAKPGQIEVKTGGFSLSPRYGRQGTITGWQGTVELQVDGRDMAGIAQLSGRINTLTISRVGYGLSREAREKVEADVAAQAIARFRDRAADYAHQFGFNSYVLREVSINTDNPPQGVMPMVRAKFMAAAAPEADLPVEAGKGTVSATVSGSVQLK
jgi:predicted secreted protein